MTNTTTPNSVYAIANGASSTNPFVDIFLPRDPTGNDTTYPIQKKWLNTITNNYFLLEKFTSTGAVIQAVWIKIGGAGIVESITGNTGGPLSPIGSNFNIVGDGTFITTNGNPATATLTISPAGELATLYTEDSGTAVPAAGNLNILGGTGIHTSGAGDTVTIASTGAVPTTFTENSGTATPSANNLNIFGSGAITASGAGSTVTITTTGSVATTYNADTGSATPSANILVLAGGTGISSSASGNTVTFNSSGGGGLSWSDASGTFTAVADHGYFITNTSTATLPASPTEGIPVAFIVDTTNILTITANTGQFIRVGTALSASAGTCANNARGDAIYFVYRVADTTWITLGAPQGTWTVT
jgi:hypothetical protein